MGSGANEAILQAGANAHRQASVKRDRERERKRERERGRERKRWLGAVRGLSVKCSLLTKTSYIACKNIKGAFLDQRLKPACLVVSGSATALHAVLQAAT